MEDCPRYGTEGRARYGSTHAPHIDAATPASWRRDRLPAPVCTCGHDHGEHRTDLLRVTCNTGQCSCPGFTLAALRWTERRTVLEPIGPPE